jgi:hypothetical protein
MTPRQKRILAILATANFIVILALTVLATQRPGTDTSPPAHSDAATLAQQTCQWQATRLLARAGLGGTVTLAPDGLLRFEITHPLTPDQRADKAAQSVWTAFDIALALQQQEECALFSRIQVTISAHSDQADVQIQASVNAVDLTAYHVGELSQDQFVERVAYTTSATSQP